MVGQYNDILFKLILVSFFFFYTKNVFCFFFYYHVNRHINLKGAPSYKVSS